MHRLMLKIKCGKKSYAGFLLVKVPRQLAPRLEIITPTKTRKPLKQQDLLASVTIGQDFPGKASHCNTFFLPRLVKFNSGRQHYRQRQNPYQKATSSKDFRLLRIFSRCQDFWSRLSKPRAFVAFGETLFLFLAKWRNFFFGPGLFLFFSKGLVSAFDFSIIVSVKSFHMGILSSTWCKWREIRAMSVSRENFPRGFARW